MNIAFYLFIFSSIQICSILCNMVSTIFLEDLRLSHRKQTILPLAAWGNILINRQPWSQNQSPLLRYCNWTVLNVWSRLNRKSSNIYSIIKTVTLFISVKVIANVSLKCICHYFSTKMEHNRGPVLLSTQKSFKPNRGICFLLAMLLCWPKYLDNIYICNRV